jgi:hypothetical protein
MMATPLPGDQIGNPDVICRGYDLKLLQIQTTDIFVVALNNCGTCDSVVYIIVCLLPIAQETDKMLTWRSYSALPAAAI